MRKTNLTREELLSILHDPKGCSLPLCLVANEIGALAKEGDERAFQKLIELLRSENPGCRFAVLGWLDECGNPAALNAIYDLLIIEKDERVVEAAMETKNRLEIILGWTPRY